MDIRQYYVFAKTKDDNIITRLVTTSDYYEVQRTMQNMADKYGNVIANAYPVPEHTYFEALHSFVDYVEWSEAQ